MKTIILAGGSGTRLWPLSRKHYPKQFLKLEQLSNQSLFQLTFKRALQVSDVNDILVITTTDQKFFVMGAIEEMGIKFPEENIIIEVMGKNTLPAISLGMEKVEDEALILPADHLITNSTPLLESIPKAKELAKDNLVIFGLKAKTPHTGYGYIKAEGHEVLNFKEKPNKQLAEQYLSEGYLWNSGIFFFNKETFSRELEKEHPQMYNYFKEKSLAENYHNIKEDSIDFGLIEKSNFISVVPLDLNWDDLGSFDSIYEIFDKDEFGNQTTGDTLLFESNNNLILGEHDKVIAMYGIDNTIVVNTPDAIMLCARSKSQNIKQVLSKLKTKNDPRTDFHKTVYRPWGSFTILEDGPNYKVKKLTVLPNKKLSLQLHNHRAEYWVIVKGIATITKGEDEFEISSGGSIFIPKETKHRIKNNTNEILEIIETQSGNYLEEDDIIRFEDEYGRK